MMPDAVIFAQLMVENRHLRETVRFLNTHGETRHAGAARPEHNNARRREVADACRPPPDSGAHEQMEQALHETESCLQDIAASIPGAVYRFQVRADNFWEILFVNESAAELFEMPAQALTDLSRVLGCICPGDLKSLHDSIEESCRMLSPWACEFRIVTGSGRTKWLGGAARPRSRPDGSVLWSGVALDITERKRMEEALCQSEEMYRAVVEGALIGIGISKGDRIVYANQSLLCMYGYDDFAEFSAQSLWDHLTPSSRVSLQRWRERKSQGEDVPCVLEQDIVRKDGAIRTLQWNITHVATRDDVYTHTTFVDVTERKKAEAALRESEESFRSLIEGAPEAIFVQSQGRFVYLNPSAVRLFGAARAEDLLGHDFMERMAPEYRDVIRERIRQQRETERAVPPMEQEYLRVDGSRVPVETTAVSIGFQGREAHLVFIRDITEQKRAQEQIRQREAELLHVTRVSTLGELASGIAHELNQPLAAIANFGDACLGLLQSQTPEMPRIVQNLRQIVTQSERAGQTIRQMRTLIKKTTPHFVSVDLNEVVRSVLALIQGEMADKSVSLALELGEPLPRVSADAIQMEQVLLNLTRNAIDAMTGGEEPSRRLTIRTKVEGDMVQMEVCDTGVGLPAVEPGRIFEPFFTTKKDGLGLGLSISRSIVQMHRGVLTALRNPERGSTFSVALPVQSSGNG